MKQDNTYSAADMSTMRNTHCYADVIGGEEFANINNIFNARLDQHICYLYNSTVYPYWSKEIIGRVYIYVINYNSLSNGVLDFEPLKELAVELLMLFCP